MKLETLCKSTLALILILLAANLGKGLTQGPPLAHHPHPDGSGDPGGTNPDPTCGDGGCFVAIHLA